jgi:hypothetical protein
VDGGTVAQIPIEEATRWLIDDAKDGLLSEVWGAATSRPASPDGGPAAELSGSRSTVPSEKRR